VEEKIYPGYVLVDMILDDDSWYVVRNTPRVTGFVGADTTKPTPLSTEEIESLMIKMGEKETKFKIDFRVGEMVKIIDGPFKDHDGKISEINEEQGKVKIKIPVFGRETAIELDLLQVNKL
ncbi:MAG: transcription termination/antitermination protein NusG, partial [Patescibacteria group bacterium]